VAAEHGWQRRFDEPIETPDGRPLNTLRKAVAYLAKNVKKLERDMADGTRLKLLTYAAERGAAWMFSARMAVSKALHRHEIVQFNPDAKEHHWGKGELKRD
jgi:hypothetical protein